MSLFHPLHANLTGADPVDVVQLIRSENIGPVTFFSLLTHYGSVRTALEAIPELSRRGGRKKPIAIFPRGGAEQEVEKTLAFGAKLVLCGEADYPKLLGSIVDPPPVIAVRGNSHLLNKNDGIAIVGARNASANGCVLAHKLAGDVGKSNITVVSGLARGIDTAAHKGALVSGTVGVIAGGIDDVYPPENEPLFKSLAEQGAIITEQPFGMAPHSRSFPGRNRIISGMSRGVVVVEASPKSGSLITAKFALEQNREIFAVPGSPLDPRCKGCNDLIRQGATLTESAEDVLNALAHMRRAPFEEAPPPGYTPPPLPPPSESELEKTRARVLEKLSFTPVAVDELILQCDVAANNIFVILLELELAGRLHRHPGNRVSLNSND